MKVTISFLHLEHTPSLDQRILEKSEKMKKYLDGKTELRWRCYVKDGQHYAEAHLHGPRFNFKATSHTESLYKSIDKTVQKMEKQLTKKKEKMRSRRADSHANLVIHDPSNAWEEYDEDNFDDINKAA